MRMTAKPSDKIISAVTGKEGFQLLAAYYLQRLQGKKTALTTADLDRMIAGLERRPKEARSYYEWCRATGAIFFISGETRVLAMKAAFKVGVIIAMMNHYLAADYIAATSDKTEKWTREAEVLAAATQTMLDDLARLHLVLEAFGEVLGCDIPQMAQEEMGMLESSVKVYNDLLVKGLKHALGCDLPHLTLTPSDIPADLKDHLIAAIHRAPGTTFLGVLDVMDRKLRCL